MLKSLSQKKNKQPLKLKVKDQEIEPIVQSNSDAMIVSEKTVVIDHYMDYLDFREKPVSLNFIKKLGLELIQWSKENPKAYKVSPFFKNKGINYTTTQRWRDRFPEFQDAYDFAKEIIGDRREELMFEGKLREKPIMFGQGQFCPEWKKQETENREALKDDGNEGTKFIIMDSFDKGKALDV